MPADGELLLRLRSGDERAFVTLVERYQEQMLRLAVSFVPSRAVAEEVVQDTWLALLRSLDAFEGRSSLKTWLFSILVNQARTTGTREHRSVPVADPEPAVDPARFDCSGSWAEPPEHWITDYLEGALSRRERRRFEAHLAGCPHCTEYLAQMRETIRLAGRLEPEDLTEQQRDEFVELYRRWRSEPG
jgi:RNA polymerase sigma-70 factor, ECF subfamily